MAKEKEVKEAEDDKPRSFGEGEGIERSTVNPEETDIFEEALSGQKRKAIERARAAMDRNDEEVAGGATEEDSDEEDEDDEDGDEEESPVKRPAKAQGEEEAEASGDGAKEEDGEEQGEEEEEPEEDAEEKPANDGKGPKADEAEPEDAEDTPEGDKEKPAKKKRGRPAKKSAEEENALEDETVVQEEETAGKLDESGKDAEEWNDEEFDYDIDHDSKEPEELKAPPREEIRKTLLAKASMAAEGFPEDSTLQAEKLAFLSDKEKKAVFIGRKGSLYKKYGFEGALQIGRVSEKEFEGNDVWLDSLNPHVVFVCGARGSGKCLTGNTLITLDNGEAVPIKELEERQEKVFALGHSLEVTPAARMDFFKRTVNKTLKVRLQSGREIELTPEHPLLTVNGWRPAENLTKDDRIATPRVLPAFGKRRMKECDVKLLAYLIAEGHLSNQFVLFSNMDEKIIADFRQSIAEFDPNLRVEQHSKPGCFRVAQVKKKVNLGHIIRDKEGRFTDKGYILMERSSIRQWLEGVGLYGKLSAEKFIPKEVMQLEKDQLALFLNRMFSCDGSVYKVNRDKNWCVSIGFASERMTREVQHLLLRFGILSTFRKKKTKCNGKLFDNYENVVYGENVLKFITEIGFFGPKEGRATTAFSEMAGHKRNPNFDTVPKEIWEKFRVYSGKELSEKLGYKRNWFSSTRSYAPSREKLLKMAQIEQNAGIQTLANADIYWDTIKEITEINGEKEVYDITVPEHHNFVANDVIVHNSYVLGVIAEELAQRNRNVGTIVVDPVGVFWSMKFPNKDEKELEKLKEWGLEANGLKNLKVFIPEGMKKEVPKSTYDAGFSIPPSLLTGEDWALTFGVDRFSVSGLLLEKAIKKVEKGYVQTEPEEGEGKQKRRTNQNRVHGKGPGYSLDDLIECLETDAELNSREKGYKQDSIRAIVSRFEAAKNWGIFHEKGTPLGELSREGQLTVLDTSFLDDNVTALVIGILARRLLAARKISTRKEAANKFKELNMNELLELEIPPTWLFIDEAHTLIPSGNEVTPATAGLIEYVKQGRRPGLSLVFATQQPSAINTKVLSQLDVIMTHKLIFDDDIKAVFKRTPTIIPRQYRALNFIKTLPVGVALTGDRREETSRAFVMGIRPRKSQHEGRDAETTQMTETFDDAQVLSIAAEMLLRDVKAHKAIDIDKARLAVDTLNLKYRGNVDFARVLRELEGEGVVAGKNSLMLEGTEEQEAGPEGTEKVGEEEEEGTLDDEAEEERRALGMDKEGLVPIKRKPTEESGSGQGRMESVAEEARRGAESLELLALPQRIEEEQARRIIDGVRKKGFLGIIGQAERIESVKVKYMPIWHVKFDSMTQRKEFIARECFINSMTGEFVHFKAGNFIESRGLGRMNELNDEEIAIVKLLQKREMTAEEIMGSTGLEEARVLRTMQKLAENGTVQNITDTRSGRKAYRMKEKLDLPPHERHEMLGSLASLPFVRTEALSVEKEAFTKEQAAEALRRLWGNVIVKRVEPLYKPVWHVVLSLDAKEREVLIDAVNGKVMKE
ncbi:MAG: DUF87 domain-containing protein [Candidatus Diapherotrites archaeon]|uniref:DUF87 domain-containing protein n=1 Tax=Candidatus Iainarchaeum sp. TaxID=3101447 RepID=A0A8T3YS91_9ARCH|nr:DUF87 domain-containing protein [Candidatus Diapherotrites archaeon]